MWVKYKNTGKYVFINFKDRRVSTGKSISQHVKTGLDVRDKN